MEVCFGMGSGGGVLEVCYGGLFWDGVGWEVCVWRSVLEDFGASRVRPEPRPEPRPHQQHGYTSGTHRKGGNAMDDLKKGGGIRRAIWSSLIKAVTNKCARACSWERP